MDGRPRIATEVAEDVGRAAAPTHWECGVSGRPNILGRQWVAGSTAALAYWQLPARGGHPIQRGRQQRPSFLTSRRNMDGPRIVLGKHRWAAASGRPSYMGTHSKCFGLYTGDIYYKVSK